jgi:hypothetical protein
MTAPLVGDFPAPVVSGQTITVQWLVNDPRRIYRMLNTLVQQRLIGHRLLAGRVDLTGVGAAIYEIAEGIFADVQSQTVAPLAEYPLTTTTPGQLATVKPLKDGLKSVISDEDIAHNRIDQVVRNLTKIANTLVFKADGLALAAVVSKVTQTQNVTSGAWNTTGANPFVDIMLGNAQIESQNKGYSANTAVMSPTAFAYAISRAAILNYMPREAAGNIVASGNMAQIAGVTYWKTTNMPSGISVIVADSTMLGSTAYERLGGNYQGDPTPPGANDFANGNSGVESKRWRDEGIDGVYVQSRLVRAPMVQEPGAAVLYTTAQIGV